MSARREARAKAVNHAPRKGAIPRSLLLGPCIEVWAKDEPNPWDAEGWRGISAFTRVKRAREAWGVTRGLDREGLQGVFGTSTGSPWSAYFMDANGFADRATERLSRADCTRDDLIELRAEAQALYALTSRAKPG